MTAAASLEMILTVLSIIGILLGALGWMLKVSNKVTVALNNVNNSLQRQTDEIAELKGYRSDIDKNKEEIQKLKSDKVEMSKFNTLENEFIELKTRHEVHHKGE